jgi:hypothetical protein
VGKQRPDLRLLRLAGNVSTSASRFLGVLFHSRITSAPCLIHLTSYSRLT